MKAPAQERTCPVSGCARVLGSGPHTGLPRLICPRHWRSVPRPLQLRIVELATTIHDQDRPSSETWASLRIAVKTAVWHAEHAS